MHNELAESAWNNNQYGQILQSPSSYKRKILIILEKRIKKLKILYS